MKEDKRVSEEVCRTAVEFSRIESRAVHKAQEKNRRLGILNAYSRNGVLYFELPDGTVTQEDPFVKDED
ncbi:MAG TPA: hypothetical protein VFG50_17690 [Rhodothermales bacterium]|nr:hypothetical protein [Rhodothermales bacterium]